MSKLVKRGRMIVAAILAFNGLLAIGAIALGIALQRDEGVLQAIIRLICQLGLMYGLWCGVRWIKWLWVLGFVLTAMLCLYALWRFPNHFPIPMAIPMAAVFAFGGGLLAFSPSVSAFFAWQRSGISETEYSADADQVCQACNSPGSGNFGFCHVCGYRLG